MKVSVITCTRNSLPLLEASVESVLAQRYPNIERIYVDGNSTDGTLDYLRRLPGESLIVEGACNGIGPAMNAGIRAASGDIVAHLHSDDYYADADAIAKVVESFERSDRLWLFGRILSDEGGVCRSEAYAIPRYSFDRLLKRNFIPHPATFVRRTLFERYGAFDEKLRYAMDYEFFLRIGRHHPPLQLDANLAVFRRHAGSATQANFMQSFREDFEVRLRHSRWYQCPEAMLRYWVRRRRHLQRLNAAPNMQT